LVLPLYDFGEQAVRKIVQRLRFLSDGSTALGSPTGWTFVPGLRGAFLSGNAEYDPNIGGWNRRDVAQPAAAIYCNPANQRMELWTAAAGANPIAWTIATVTAAQLARVAQLATDTGWANLAFAANWSNFGAGLPTAQYKIDVRGWVCLKGLVKKGVALLLPDTIGTLPAGFRPATVHLFLATSAAGATEIRVDTAGNVFIQTGGSPADTSLDGIAFDPAT
jgi:hypothetical protein